MKPDTRLYIAGQWLVGLLFGAIALYCGWISLQMNVRFGMQFSETTAQIFAVSDIAKIMLPIMAAYIGWTRRQRIAWAVAIIISITAALSSLLQDQAQVIKDNQAISQTVESAQKTADRARREMQAISETMSVAALQALVVAKNEAAEREANRGSCGPICEGIKTEHAELLIRLGQAQRRDSLQAQLDQATAAIAQTPEKANGPSDHLATLSGGDKLMIASVFSALVSVAQLVILEFLATFSGDAGATIRNAINAMRRNRPAKRVQRVATPAQPVATPAPKRATKAYYQERLEREFPHFAGKVQRGEMSVFAACIETGLRKRPKSNWASPVAYGIKESANA